MYSSGYSQVSKYSPQAQKKMQYRSKGKSCGYYMRIVFFFSSLIQSLIIVSLVLFLIYGKTQDSASTSRIQDLEESFSRLSIENVALRNQRKNLTTLLNSTLTEKARNDWDLVKCIDFANTSLVVIKELDRKLQQCDRELNFCKTSGSFPGPCPQISFPCKCGPFVDQLKARLELVQSNFTQTVQRMRMEMDQTAKERDNLNLEAIRLRRDKSTHEKEVQIYRRKCKEDFVLSLSGVSNVTKAFLQKIDSLFPLHIPFQITCEKQREHLEQIRTNCTSLSREVEDKYQHYLNSVGDQVSGIQSENSRLKAENWRLSEDYRWCSQNRTGLIKDNKQNLEKLQSKHDEEKERLLMEKMRLNGDIQVLENSVNYKNKEVEHLREQLKQLNITCMVKPGSGGFPGGSPSRGSTTQNGWGAFGGLGSSSASSSSSNVGQPGRTGSVPSFGSTGTGSSSSLFPSGSGSSTGLGLNRGTGSSSSSLFPSGSGSSTGLGLNRGTGSSSSSLFPSGSGSSTGSGLNKIGSTGVGSSSLGSTGLNPSLSSTGRGSSTIGSSSGSTGSSSSFSSSGSGLNKPTTNVKSSSGFGSSSGSTGSASKSGSSSSAFSSWLGLGSSNSGQSKTGSGTGKGTSSGTSFGGTGSSTGTGRTNGLVGGSVNVAQHLQDLQRFINPPGPEEKQDLSRMLG